MASWRDASDADSGAKAAGLPPDWFEGHKDFRVVLEGINRDIETPESFAIKFSILLKIPITKAKHIINHLPAVLYHGETRARAERILALIVEAGGVGKVIEEESAPPEKTEAERPEERPCCNYCGFPLKEGDAHCEFCMSSVKAKPREAPKQACPAPKAAVSIKRLVLYLCILAVGIVVVLVLR